MPNNTLSIRLSNAPIISIQELNIIIDSSNAEVIDIYFTEHIDRFNIVFIAGILLLHRLRKCTFTISYLQPSLDRIFEVRQYLKQFEEIYGSPWREAINSFKGIPKTTDSDLVTSKSYSPILLINKETFGPLFQFSNRMRQQHGMFKFWEATLQRFFDRSLKREKEYFSGEPSIKLQLLNHPPIYTFAFIIIYDKVAPFSGRAKTEDAERRIEELWQFTNEYVSGLAELAKNIVEHSSTGEGIITIRAYDGEEVPDQQVSKLLETYLFDYGTIGIIPKLYNDTLQRTDEPLYKDDLKILEDNFTISNLLNSTVRKKLNQQIYRELAHYGLVKFYRLIEKNKGIASCSSRKIDGDKDFYSTNRGNNDKSFNIGTSYFFQVPFHAELFRAVDDFPIPEEMQGQLQTLGGVSQILNYRVVKEGESMEAIDGEILIADVNIVASIMNRQEEVNLFRRFQNLHGMQPVSYCSINLASATITSSTLLRFLSHLSTRYDQNFILYNVEFELYDEFIRDNTIFYQNINGQDGNIPYWFEGKAILIYTTIRGKNFNFADFLYGNTRHDFQMANYLISHTFPNTLSITDPLVEKLEKKTVPLALKPFLYKSSLLPFDVLLTHSSEKTLFQANLTYSLNQELNPPSAHEQTHSA